MIEYCCLFPQRDICGRTPSTASTSNRLLFPAWAGLSLAPVLQIALTLFFWHIWTLESRHGQTQASGLPSTLLEPRVRVRGHLFPPKLRCRVAPNHLEQTLASRTTSVVYFVRIPATLLILPNAGNSTLLRILKP